VVSRFTSAPSTTLKLKDDTDPLTLFVEANPRQSSRMRQYGDKAGEVLKFYTSLLNDAPYDSFTLAVTEGDLPGGHSPAYFALLNQPLPTTPYVWTNDPVSFPNYQSFFLAHEVAHQWWGQAVGWKNYHEQWISEGFAQYFAALFAEKERGPETFGTVIRQMRRWAVDMSPQGPVYLGYRLGHIRSEGRVFRALVYNKGAMVLHMLRRLIGDEAFFAGLREFYTTWRYKKAGTNDFRASMEKAAGGRSLERFFDRWIFSSGIPTVRFTSTVEGSLLKVRFEQKDEIYDIPIVVTITYTDGTSEDVVVVVAERTVEQTVELKRAVRSVEVNKDGGALAEIVK
jgi:aminopeptidase N